MSVTGHIKVGTGWFGRDRKDADEIIEQLEASPPVEIDDGLVRVGYIRDRSLRRNVTISYEIVVPATTQVKSHTGSGSQTVTGVGGPVDIDAGSGSLTLNAIGGPVKARAGSGSIRADGVAGAFEAHTGSGSIWLTQTSPGDVKVTAGSGSSTLHGVVGALSVRSGSGRIEVDGQQTGRWDLSTGSGSVRVKLPEDAAFTLDAESNSGGITVDHPVTVEGRVSRKHLKGEVRGGGELLRVDTGSGEIRVE